MVPVPPINNAFMEWVPPDDEIVTENLLITAYHSCPWDARYKGSKNI
jgi:hypothetical protein